jgi:hypothetical protein
VCLWLSGRRPAPLTVGERTPVRRHGPGTGPLSSVQAVRELSVSAVRGVAFPVRAPGPEPAPGVRGWGTGVARGSGVVPGPAPGPVWAADGPGLVREAAPASPGRGAGAGASWCPPASRCVGSGPLSHRYPAGAPAVTPSARVSAGERRPRAPSCPAARTPRTAPDTGPGPSARARPGRFPGHEVPRSESGRGRALRRRTRGRARARWAGPGADASQTSGVGCEPLLRGLHTGRRAVRP